MSALLEEVRARPDRQVAVPARRASPWNSRVWLLAGLALLIVLPLVPGAASDFARSLLTQMAIAVVFALSFNLLFGETGLLSFGHAVYFGLGAYAAIHGMRAINHGVPVPMLLVPLIGALGGLLSGAAFGAVTTRRAGTIFALISLGMGELVYASTFMLPSIFGGEEGISASRTRASVNLGLDLGSQLAVYYVALAWSVVAVLLMYAFTRTPAGRMCNAVRDNPERAEFVGYRAQGVRFVAFTMAGLFAGLAGGLHALNYEIVAADAVGAQRSGAVLIMAYIGGAGHFAGPVLGAVVVTWLQTSLSSYTSAWVLYVGVFFMLMIVYAPRGLIGIVLRHRDLVRRSGGSGVLAAYGLAAIPLTIVLAGAIVLIEMSYRLSTQPELGTRMRLLWMPVDAASPMAWIASALAVIVGGILLGIAVRRVARAWDRLGRMSQ